MHLKPVLYHQREICMFYIMCDTIFINLSLALSLFLSCSQSLSCLLPHSLLLFLFLALSLSHSLSFSPYSGQEDKNVLAKWDKYYDTMPSVPMATMHFKWDYFLPILM